LKIYKNLKKILKK